MPAVSLLRRTRLPVLVAALGILLLSVIADQMPVEAQAPSSAIGSSPLLGLSGATQWINSKPLTAKQLKGKVVLIDFWTYSCINCLRAVPYVEAWAEKYKDSGLVVIGVHSPEFEFETNLPNVQKAIQKFGITYPVALDSNHAIWDAFHNEYWPAHYFLDATGKVRHEHFGEGEYDQSERWIQELLSERAKPTPSGMVSVHAQGVEVAPDAHQVQSPETYVGYSRADRFASPGGIKFDAEQIYILPPHLVLNEWGLSGKWADNDQFALLKEAGGKIAFCFHARDLHLVLGPAAGGKLVRFRVRIDGQVPGNRHGVDSDPEGNGTVVDHRLYQLIRQNGAIADHTFEIEFLDPGVQAFAFTFG